MLSELEGKDDRLLTLLAEAPQRDPGRQTRLGGGGGVRRIRIHQAPRLGLHRPWRSGTDLSPEGSEGTPKSIGN